MSHNSQWMSFSAGGVTPGGHLKYVGGHGDAGAIVGSNVVGSAIAGSGASTGGGGLFNPPLSTFNVSRHVPAPFVSATAGSSMLHASDRSGSILQQRCQQRPSNNSDFAIGVFSVGSTSSSAGSTMPVSGGAGNTMMPIGEFRIGGSSDHMSANGMSGGSSSGAVGGIRETGIIEKMLPTFGFIQCCERQARLFFHFSQFDGNIEHLRVGDPVEFEMTYDRRNGKPIASNVTKISPETPQLLSEERATGTVTSELRSAPHPQQGRISYENRGECFFLPFGAGDVEGNVSVCVGDLVSFQMVSDPRNGNLVAHNVRLENPANPIRYRGVVCAINNDQRRGYIERADVVREIVFALDSLKNSSESGIAGAVCAAKLGDEVEFTIQTVQGKEVATDIVQLERGSVVMEDVDPTAVKGQVQKALDHVTAASAHSGDGSNNSGLKESLSGRIRYRRGDDNSVVDVSFGERDMSGNYTLRHGDWVQFNVTVDRRDRMRRATNIQLLEESFLVSDEKREQGVLLSIKENLYGFIKCVERDQNLFFHLSEVIDDRQRRLQARDELEFTVVADTKQTGRFTAVRVRRLPPGTVRFDELLAAGVNATVSREPAQAALRDTDPGQLCVQLQQLAAEQLPAVSAAAASGSVCVSYRHSAVVDMRQCPRTGDTVKFDLMRTRRTGALFAANVTLLRRATPPPPANNTVNGKPRALANTQLSDAGTSGVQSNEDSTVYYGYLAALKDGFGFIETQEHDREIFFHYSNVRENNGGTGDGSSTGDGASSPVERLKLGAEVQYTLTRSSGRVSADNVQLVAPGTIPSPRLAADILDGIVVRPIRCVDPEQAEYSGLVQLNTTDEVAPAYQFGITSLVNKRQHLQMGDSVTFQVDVDGLRAYNILVQREKLQARVESVKGQYGFLDYQYEDGKKLFFHVSEVEDGVSLQPGDLVQFSVVHSLRSGRHSACSVVRLAVAAPGSNGAATGTDGDDGAGGSRRSRGVASFTSQTERPERVIQRIRSLTVAGGGTGDLTASPVRSNSCSSEAHPLAAGARPRLVSVLRQPRGPDEQQKGFHLVRHAAST